MFEDDFSGGTLKREREPSFTWVLVRIVVVNLGGIIVLCCWVDLCYCGIIVCVFFFGGGGSGGSVDRERIKWGVYNNMYCTFCMSSKDRPQLVFWVGVGFCDYCRLFCCWHRAACFSSSSIRLRHRQRERRERQGNEIIAHRPAHQTPAQVTRS